MELKFLPLGSVCVVKNLNKKQVVIGYENREYDYIGVSFPNGFRDDQDVNYFNHNDIIELYSYGYKDEESKIYVSSLPLKSIDAKVEVDNKTELEEIVDVVLSPNANAGYLFDENGVVVADKLASEVVAPQKAGFSYDENGVVIGDKKETLPSSNYQFDENGVVIGDKKEAVDVVLSPNANAGYLFDENGVVVADKLASEVVAPQKTSFSYDENGVVIGDKKETLPSSNYQFDENGVVIGDKKEAVDVVLSPNANAGYLFDENGVVVADKLASEVVAPQKASFSYDENGVVADEEEAPIVEENVDVKFDENGMVILEDENLTSKDVEIPIVVNESVVISTGEPVEAIEEAPIAEEEETDDITFNDDEPLNDDESIFGDIPGLSSDELEPVGEALDLTDDVVYAPLSDDIMLSSNPSDEVSFDIPDPEEAVVPSDPAELDTFEDENDEKPEEIEIVEEVKPEKKKRGFFNFGR